MCKFKKKKLKIFNAIKRISFASAKLEINQKVIFNLNQKYLN